MDKLHQITLVKKKWKEQNKINEKRLRISFVKKWVNPKQTGPPTNTSLKCNKKIWSYSFSQISKDPFTSPLEKKCN